MRHVLSVSDWTRQNLDWILNRAGDWLRRDTHATDTPGPQAALLLERPSFRTRIAYEQAIHWLGGCLTVFEGGVGTHDSIQDVVRVLSGMLDIAFVRTRDHNMLESMASMAEIPIVNALSDREHPVEVLADAVILREHFGDLSGKKIAFVGHGGNVCASVVLLAPLLGMDVALACPDGRLPDPVTLERATDLARAHGTHVEVTSKIGDAASQAAAVYTDGWPVMDDAEARERMFGPYRVTSEVMSLALPDAVFLHCLPAERGNEVTDKVLDSDQSLAFQRVRALAPTSAAVTEWALGQDTS